MCTSYEYLLTTTGVLKILHIIFGVVSLSLLADSFLPVTEDIFFVSVVASIFAVSLIYLLCYLAWPRQLTTNTLNGRIDFLYHIAAGLCLIAAGIDITTWQDYFEFCNDNCPSFYTKGVAKILTFINGVLYGIVAFLSVKEETLIKAEELTDSDLEDFEQSPLMIKVPRIYQYRTISTNSP